jgi:hypothetical protein
VRRRRKDHEALLAEHRWALGVFARHIIAGSAPGMRRHFFVLTADDAPGADPRYLR